MTVVDDELFFFFAAVILAALFISVSNSIVKFADLLILILMEIVAFFAPISVCSSALFLPSTSISVMVSSSLNSTAHLLLS